jgi:1-phosphofructokinase
LLEGLGGERRLVPAVAASGCYVIDRRSAERRLLASVLSDPPSRDELDELFSLAIAEGVSCGWLVVTNPMPAESLPLELYRDLVADARAGGCRTIVDLSSPRLDSALRGGPDLVKLNDWELAEFARGPVSEPGELHSAISALRDRGARAVVLTRGEKPALLLDGENAYEVTPPRLEHGFREGCGDAMLGALAGAWARGDSLQHAVVVGAAAGAANFLRHDLGSASREAVEKLTDSVKLSAIAF